MNMQNLSANSQTRARHQASQYIIQPYNLGRLVVNPLTMNWRHLPLITVMCFVLILTSFSSSAAPAAPSCISAPSSATENVAYSISWCSVSGATYYSLVGEQSGQLLTTSSTIASRTKSAGTYYYKVSACNSSGCSGYSSTTSGTTVVRPTPPPSVPGCINAPSSAYSGQSYTVSWCSANGNISHYELVGEQSSTIFSGMSLSTVRNKSPGIYHYKVRACGAGGCSNYTATTSGTQVSNLPVPGAPVTPTASPYVPVNTVYSVSWSTPGGSVTRYELYENNILMYSGSNTSASFNYSNYGTRIYKVRACNNSGCGNFSSNRNVVAYTEPGTPGSFIASPSSVIQGNSTTLSWTQPGGVVPGLTYKLYGTSPGSSESFLGDLTVADSQRTLSYIGQYQYRVRACNPNNLCGGSAILHITSHPFAPGKPGDISGPSEAAIGTGVGLNWSSASGVVSHYELYLGSSLLYRGTNSSYSHTPTSIATLSYKVRACNSGGCGAYSNNKSVTVFGPTGQVNGLSANPNPVIMDQNVVISWNAPSGAASSITYKLYGKAPGGSESLLESGLSTRQSTRQPALQGTYQYAVEACNPNVACGAKTSVALIVNAPTIGVPGKPTVENTVPMGEAYQVNWTAAAGAVNSYELYEDGLSVYNGTTLNYSVAAATEGSHVYKVRACYKPGVCSSFSGETVVTVTGRPMPVPDFSATPSSIHQGEHIRLNWTIPQGFSQGGFYKLFGTAPGSEEQFLINLSGTTSERTPAHLGEYRYRIQACNTEALCSESRSVVVTVTSPLEVIVNRFGWEPENVTVGKPTIFHWDIDNVQECFAVTAGQGSESRRSDFGHSEAYIYYSIGEHISKWYCTDMQGDRFPATGYLEATRRVLPLGAPQSFKQLSN